YHEDLLVKASELYMEISFVRPPQVGPNSAGRDLAVEVTVRPPDADWLTNRARVDKSPSSKAIDVELRSFPNEHAGTAGTSISPHTALERQDASAKYRSPKSWCRLRLEDRYSPEQGWRRSGAATARRSSASANPSLYRRRPRRRPE